MTTSNQVTRTKNRSSTAILMAAAILTALIALMVMGPTNTNAQTLSSDATLSAITVTPGTVHGFAADQDSYEVGVASTVNQATVTATTTDTDATVAYSGTDADDTTDGHQVDLSAGQNTVTVTVTAEDETTTQEYTVNINRGVTDDYGWKASDDLDGLRAAENDIPTGIWSDGTTIWVADGNDSKLYAYNIATKQRDATKDFSTLVVERH